MCSCSGNCDCANVITYSKGEKGDPGSAGPTGATGATGATGPAGDSGIANIEVVTAATRTILEADSGTLFVLDRAAGIAMTVPSDPADATWYEFEVKTDVTASSYSITLTNGSGTELLSGFIYGKKSATADERFLPDLVNDVVISMNGTTTGGTRGTSFRIVYDKPNVRWYTSGYFYGSGTLATPFS